MNKAVARPQKAKVSNQQMNDAQQRDFLLLYSLAGQGNSLSEAVHALYYLPQNYKLVVLTDAAASTDDVAALMNNIAIMDRIRFEETAESAEQASPFSYVINNDDDAITIEASDNRTVKVSAHHPEAFASAVLNLTRARA